MRLDILGCRASTPAPGPDFVRYGGDTSCVAISPNGGMPSLILDAGTGLRHVGALLGDGEAFRGTILLSHLHWDHTHGLPFSPPIDTSDSVVRLLMPEQADDPSVVLARAMSPPHFPIGPDQLNGDWEIDFITEETHEIESFEVTAAEIFHKGGKTLGYRISDNSSSLAYMSDHSIGDDGAMDLAEGVDLLIHDAQYTSEEQEQKASFGHCSIEQAIDLAEKAEVGRLLLFHHDFNRTDDEIDEMLSDLRGSSVPVAAAAQGQVWRI